MSVDCDICERSFSVESEKYEHILQMVAHTGYMWAKYKALESRHRDLVATIKAIEKRWRDKVPLLMEMYAGDYGSQYELCADEIREALKEEQ